VKETVESVNNELANCQETVKSLETLVVDTSHTLVYVSVGAFSLLLFLLLMLIKFIRSSKMLQKLYDKIYDKILDEIADKLLVGLGIKEDEHFKEKIKKLVELNKSRKNGDMKLKEYIYKVDVILD
jgi:hypothetical protein